MTPWQRMALTLEVFLLDLPVLWRSPSKETGRLMSSWAATGPRALLPRAQSNASAVGAGTSWTLTQRSDSQSQKPWEEKAREVPGRAGRTEAKGPLWPGHPCQGGQWRHRAPPRTGLPGRAPTSRGAEISFAEGNPSGSSCESRPRCRTSRLSACPGSSLPAGTLRGSNGL